MAQYPVQFFGENLECAKQRAAAGGLRGEIFFVSHALRREVLFVFRCCLYLGIVCVSCSSFVAHFCLICSVRSRQKKKNVISFSIISIYSFVAAPIHAQLHVLRAPSTISPGTLCCIPLPPTPFPRYPDTPDTRLFPGYRHDYTDAGVQTGTTRSEFSTRCRRGFSSTIPPSRPLAPVVPSRCGSIRVSWSFR